MSISREPLHSLRLSPSQLTALRQALAGAITKADRYAKYTQQRTGALPAAQSTIDVLLRLGLIGPSRFEHSEFVATSSGIRLGRRLGLPTIPSVLAPPTIRERAFVLRELTLPNVWACGDRDAYQPRRLGLFPGNEQRWVEALGYGHFRPSSGCAGACQLVLTPKGQQLVSATDTPITLRVGAEMARSIARGTLRQVLVPDPWGHRTQKANFQILAPDHLGSPRDTWARLYDPAAIFPRTIIRLVHAKSGKLLATARAGDWNRIWFRANEGKGHPVFDVIYEYSTHTELDQYANRIWVAFPYDTGEYAPCARSIQFAADCGFESINSMRRFWLRRAPEESAGRKVDVHGLLLSLDDLRILTTPPARERTGVARGTASQVLSAAA